MTLAEVRRRLYDEYNALATLYTKFISGDASARLEIEIIDARIDNLLNLEHALQRAQSYAYTVEKKDA